MTTYCGGSVKGRAWPRGAPSGRPTITAPRLCPAPRVKAVPECAMTDGTVVLIGTLDTKGEECAFLRDRLQLAGLAVVVVDVGTLGPARVVADVSREQVAAEGGI